jgi:hypothetical protein
MTDKRAYFGDKLLKSSRISQVKKQIDDGVLKHGSYGKMEDDGVMRGCAVFVTTCDSTSPHETMWDELNIPIGLAYLEDIIFEYLEQPHDRDWPVKFLDAIPVGADLSFVEPKFMLWLMQENLKHEQLWRAHDERNEYADKVVNAINRVSVVLKNWIATGKLDQAAADSARMVALAAESAADSVNAAERAVADSAKVAAWAACAAAEWDSESVRAVVLAAESAASAWSAEQAFYVKMSEKLLELLGEAPIPKEGSV